MKTSGLADSPLFVKTMIKESKQPRHQVTTVSFNQDTMVVTISDALREVGKNAATYRLTSSEKRVLADVIYSFRKKGIRISENEIVRIAINFVIFDYDLHKEISVINKVIDYLNV